MLVYAHREGSERHEEYRGWLRSVAEGAEPYGIPDVVAMGFLRVVTHPKVWAVPTPIDTALEAMRVARERPNHVHVSPGPRHWGLFADLCRSAAAKGNLVPDAFLAAVAIESGAELATTDRDFARFSGLRWRHPLEG